jgi:hypothetical protein
MITAVEKILTSMKARPAPTAIAWMLLANPVTANSQTNAF